MYSEGPPLSVNLRYLTRFAQYSGFPCVVKSWRGISCDLSSARPETWDPHAVKERSETVGLGHETYRLINFRFHSLIAISSVQEDH